MTFPRVCATIGMEVTDWVAMVSTLADGLPMLPGRRAAPRLYAGFWRRVSALLIDALILAAMDWVVVTCFGLWIMLPSTLLHGDPGPALAGWIPVTLQPFAAVAAWLYYAVCESSPWRATPGKLAVGLRVTDERGRRIGFARASGRCFGKLVSVLTCGLGFLCAGWTVRKQALHDALAGCCVVRKSGLDAWRKGQAQTRRDLSATPRPVVVPGWVTGLAVTGACLLLVLVIAGFLVAFAIPAYHSHGLRVQIEEGIALSARARALVGEYIGERGSLPGNNRVLGLPEPAAIRARYVTSVRVAGGKIVVTYGNQADPVLRGRHLVMAPYGNATLLHWQCTSPDIHVRLLPQQCR